MNKPPAFQFYAKDWLASSNVRRLSWAARGLYIELLAICWDNDGLPREPEAIRRLAHVERRDWERLWPHLAASFPERKNGRMNPKLAKVRREQMSFLAKKSRAGKKGNKVRWQELQEEDGDRTATDVRVAKPSQVRHPLRSPASASASAVAGKSTTKPSAPAAPRTWLTPFGEAWQAVYGGEPPYGQLANYFKPLLEAHDQGEVLERWIRYLEATEAQYVSPARFAQTYGKWGKPERPRRDALPDMYLTLEEQEARRAKRAQGPAPANGQPEGIADVLARAVPRKP